MENNGILLSKPALITKGQKGLNTEEKIRRLIVKNGQWKKRIENEHPHQNTHLSSRAHKWMPLSHLWITRMLDWYLHWVRQLGKSFKKAFVLLLDSSWIQTVPSPLFESEKTNFNQPISVTQVLFNIFQYLSPSLFPCKIIF